MLARRLLTRQIPNDSEKIDRILGFLCSESGSHDYPIYRREARDQLGLTIERPNDDLYKRIKAIYDDFAADLQLTEPYSPDVALAGQPQREYRFKRCLVETVLGGSHEFVSEGTLMRRQIQQSPGVLQFAVEDRRTFEGWRHSNG
jgi:hypothetical protein